MEKKKEMENVKVKIKERLKLKFKIRDKTPKTDAPDFPFMIPTSFKNNK